MENSIGKEEKYEVKVISSQRGIISFEVTDLAEQNERFKVNVYFVLW